MSNTITAEELDLIAALKALPKLPVVVAGNMLYAQGVKISSEDRATIAARQNILRKLGLKGSVRIKVQDFTGAHIGDLTFGA